MWQEQGSFTTKIPCCYSRSSCFIRLLILHEISRGQAHLLDFLPSKRRFYPDMNVIKMSSFITRRIIGVDIGYEMWALWSITWTCSERTEGKHLMLRNKHSLPVVSSEQSLCPGSHLANFPSCTTINWLQVRVRTFPQVSKSNSPTKAINVETLWVLTACDHKNAKDARTDVLYMNWEKQKTCSLSQDKTCHLGERDSCFAHDTDWFHQCFLLVVLSTFRAFHICTCCRILHIHLCFTFSFSHGTQTSTKWTGSHLKLFTWRTNPLNKIAWKENGLAKNTWPCLRLWEIQNTGEG